MFMLWQALLLLVIVFAPAIAIPLWNASRGRGLTYGIGHRKEIDEDGREVETYTEWPLIAIAGWLVVAGLLGEFALLYLLGP